MAEGRHTRTGARAHRRTAGTPGVRWARARALLAAGVVVGVGSAATLASWTDTEWVWGGNSSGDAVAASIFEVQQNLWDGAGGAAAFVDRETAESGGELDFSLAAGALSPGVTVFAPMQLRTVPGSDAATLTLGPAALRTGDPAFFSALTYGVRTGVAKGDCTAGGFATGTPLVAQGTTLTTGSGTTSLTLGAGGPGTPGPAVDVCFAVTLPAGAPDALQGKGASPLWSFQAISG
ncbi:SipW-dependent-type signal peptide-containing protein [Aquipuribacter hungaricus]|uniref:SipW-dependent-type signal peptide-containing protein n=1 Tax=Aquipuribacter hungaricus TaxID=545624 RepID=A0ABV7WES5_9MICO